MPVVIPAGASSSSSAQVVAGQSVFDYVLDSTGAAVPNVKVTAILNGDFITSISPQVLISPTQLTVTTDGNGFWQMSLIPNTNLSPANTTYTIQNPFRSYDIQVGPSGPYQSTSLGTLISIPATLGPATSSITGALTVSGAFTATAGATISGGLTLATGVFSIPGGSFSMAGPLTLTAAASQIIPGATSFSVRDTGNANDNLLVTNAGLVTARAGLVVTAGGLTVSAGGATITGNSTVTGTLTVTSTINSQTISAAANLTGSLVVANGLTVTAGGLIVTAGNVTVTAGNLIFAAAASQIVPGATSLALRDNANANNNLLLSNAGLATFRNGIISPPAAAGAVPTTTYGTVSNLLDSQTGSAVASLTLNVTGGNQRTIRLEIEARSDQAGSQAILVQFNADVGANYDSQWWQDTNTTITGIGPTVASTSGHFGEAVATGAAAGAEGGFTVIINDADSTTLRKFWHFAGGTWATDAAGSAQYEAGHGQWRNTTNAITAIKLIPGAGNFSFIRARAYSEP